MDNGLHSSLVSSSASSIQKRCERNSHSRRVYRMLRFLKSKLALSALNVTRAPLHDIVSSISIGSLVRGFYGKSHQDRRPLANVAPSNHHHHQLRLLFFPNHCRHYRLTIILSLQIYLSYYSCCRRAS